MPAKPLPPTSEPIPASDPSLRFENDEMACAPCGKQTPHRQFGDVWRCSECGGISSTMASTPANNWNRVPASDQLAPFVEVLDEYLGRILDDSGAARLLAFVRTALTPPPASDQLREALAVQFKVIVDGKGQLIRTFSSGVPAGETMEGILSNLADVYPEDAPYRVVELAETSGEWQRTADAFADDVMAYLEIMGRCEACSTALKASPRSPDRIASLRAELASLRVENERTAKDYVDACEEITRLRSSSLTAEEAAAVIAIAHEGEPYQSQREAYNAGLARLRSIASAREP